MSVADDELLDEIREALATLPEPLAAAAVNIEVARAEGDITGVRKHCFELGIDVVRYGTALALGALAQELGGKRPPAPIAKALGGAARMTDGQWCALLRTLAGQLKDNALMSFSSGKALATLVESRNRFIHDGARGEDAAERLLAVLKQAEPMLAVPLSVVKALDPPVVQQRAGVPLRAGAWRKKKTEPPTTVAAVGAYWELGDTWLGATPWLPSFEDRLLIPDCPPTSGKPWRSLDPETGERRTSAELDAGVRALLGDDSAAPVLPAERPGLVGRADVLDTMKRTAELTREGGIYLLALTGPQGIGRGRLLEVMREAAAGFGFGVVIDAACSQARTSPLRPLRRAIAPIDHLAQARAMAEQVAHGDAVAGRAGLEAAVEAVEEALVDASETEPILLSLDDAQWADEPTLQLLSLLAERATRKAKGHMLVLLGVRDEPTASSDLRRLIAQIERDVGPAATRLRLGPLGMDDVRRLARNVAPIDRRLEEALAEGAGGVPFFVVQSLLAWFETGALAWSDGAWRPLRDGLLTEPVPGMADVVRAQLAACFEPGSTAERVAHELLWCIGAAGGSAPLGQLVGALERIGRTAEEAEHALELLGESGILSYRPDRREHGFGQGMVRQAVMAELRDKPWAPRVQRALYEIVAEQGGDEDAAFLARGYRELGDDAAAARELGRAIAYGMRVGMFRDAAGWAEELAELSRSPSDKARALLAAADAWLRMGEARTARERLDAVVATGDAEIAVHARILRVAIASALGKAHDDEALIADADAVSPAVGVEARLAWAKRVRGVRGLALVEEAVVMLPPDVRPELRYQAMVLRFEIMVEVRGLEDAGCRAAAAEANSAVRDVGSMWAELDQKNDQAVLEIAAQRYREALALLQDVVREAKRHHFGSVHRGALVNLAAVHRYEGRLDAACSVAEQAMGLARAAGDSRNLAMASSARADALLKLGRHREALADIDTAVTIGLQVSDANLPLRLLRRADVRKELGDLTGACEDAESALRHAVSAGSTPVIARARLRLAIARFDLGEADARMDLEKLVCDVDGAEAPAPIRLLIEQARIRLES